jgi:hypothetical protein
MAATTNLGKIPTACAYCGQPFKQKENHRFAWRSTSGKLYCSEFCAGDEEEAVSQNSLFESIRAVASPS